MPALLQLDAYLEALEIAGERLAADALDAGLDATVPTCPTWDMRALVAHQAMVHRWAAAHVSGGDPASTPNQTAIRDYDDVVGYYHEGLHVLVNAIKGAPDNLRAMTFLNDAPAPRLFWARRQAHETTMHGVDALAARLSRMPTAQEAAVTTEIAVDGLDELLRGFFTRGASKLHDGVDEVVLVAPTDVSRRWALQVGSTLRVEDEADRPDAVLAGTSTQLYLGLWNRGDEIDESGNRGVLERWRVSQRVSWR